MNRTEIKLLERGERVRRRALNSPLTHGSNETVLYFADFTPWGASEALPVSLPVITVEDQDGNDVTATIFAADDAAVIDSVEVQFTLAAITQGDRYRLFIKGTIDSLIGECWTFIDGER